MTCGNRGKCSAVTDLEKAVKTHVEYYRAAEDRVSRKTIITDLRKDSQYQQFVEDLGLPLAHPKTPGNFERLAWDHVRRYLSSREGWWAKSRGRGCEFVHQTWATPEEWRDVCNYRINQRDEDQAKLNLAIELTKTRCHLDNYTFDPQHDEHGRLVRVEVWARA
jgi:hypothetical protein